MWLLFSITVAQLRNRGETAPNVVQVNVLWSYQQDWEVSSQIRPPANVRTRCCSEAGDQTDLSCRKVTKALHGGNVSLSKTPALISPFAHCAAKLSVFLWKTTWKTEEATPGHSGGPKSRTFTLPHFQKQTTGQQTHVCVFLYVCTKSYLVMPSTKGLHLVLLRQPFCKHHFAALLRLSIWQGSSAWGSLNPA